MLNLDFVDPSALNCLDIFPDQNVCELIDKTVRSEKLLRVPDEKRIVSISHQNQVRHYLFSVTAIRGRDRNLSGIVLLLRDVTRLKEVERLKSEFVMAASHELRTPLTSLGMSVDLLLEHVAPDLGEKEREILQAAHEEVHRMMDLVNDLLDLSKLEAGKIDLEFESISAAGLFEKVRAVFKGQTEMKMVTLAAEPAEALPMIRADANKIAWVLTNLVSNALRYVRQGGNITLLATRTGQQIQLSVHDDGPGIPKEYQSKIFQKFVQVKGQETGGTGLGLAICKEIVRAHGGSIWVESTPGQGSTFSFTLPVKQ